MRACEGSLGTSFKLFYKSEMLHADTNLKTKASTVRGNNILVN